MLRVKDGIGSNASTATALQTARTINGTSFNGTANITTANWGTARTLTIGNTGKSVNGSANVSWSLSEIGAVAENGGVGNNLIVGKYLKFADYDDGTSTLTNTYVRDGVWNTSFSQIVATSFKGSLSGNAATATKLATARNINGVAFDGTTDITITAAANGGTSAACSGNAATATKLATARTISLTGSVTGSGTFDGSGNLSIATTTNHSHSYLPLSGGSLTGPVNNSYATSTYLAGNQGKTLINSTCSAGTYTMLYKYPSTNGYFTIGGYQGNFLLQYTAKTTVDAGTNSVTKSVTLLNESGNTSFPGTVSASGFSGNASTATKLQTARTINGVSFDGSANITITAAANGGTSSACSGNSATATTLATARTINGTSFNGSANITTANWGTARTITIGSTGKSVNGSGNVSWSLSEIGAAAASHSHSYLSTSGGTVSGGLTINPGAASGKTLVFGKEYTGGSGTEPTLCPNTSGGWGTIGVSGKPLMKMYSYGYTNASDRALKYDIAKLDNELMYDYVKELNTYSYRHISVIEDEDNVLREDYQIGCMVDELPIEIVDYDNEGGEGKSVDIYAYTTMNIGATKCLIQKVESLEIENENKEFKIQQLEEKINKLEEIINGVIN